jgi:hypothetical protein
VDRGGSNQQTIEKIDKFLTDGMQSHCAGGCCSAFPAGLGTDRPGPLYYKRGPAVLYCDAALQPK